ncbi:MAG: class I SAM-dependent methyltransferase [Proteobacteria bacterium]|nr:MAG: class I SAM-dependent methyltransferase [Pseudomonadota bacterium]
MKHNKTYLDIPLFSHPSTSDAHTFAETDQSGVWPLETWLLTQLLNTIGSPSIAITLWDGEEHYAPAAGAPVARMLVKNRPTLWRLFTNPNLNFGDDYSRGTIEIDGDLVDFLEALFRARAKAHRPSPIQRFFTRGRARSRRNTLDVSPENVHHHYDLGNDFYRLWLDREMAYTCAYFPTPDATLEEAQLAKMDHVCRKLDLKPGETVVEAGCGWGSMARHMALRYGVTVRAYNISAEQIRFARQRAKAEGFDDRVEYVQDDYRTISGEYDVFVSIGMLEHVGIENYAALGALIDRVLHSNGRGLIHTIGQNRPEPTSAWTERRLFPGGYAPTLRQMMDIFEGPGLSVIDVENLRLHYALTLNHWLSRYERNIGQVSESFDGFFARAWRLYLAASIANFNVGSLQLYQVLFARAMKNDGAWTRAHLYH